MVEFLETSIVLSFLFVFSAYFFLKKSLDFSGIVSANIVGLLVFLAPSGGLKAFFAVLVFFILAEFFTRFGRKNVKSHEPRSVGNIFGNSAIAVIALWWNVPIAFFGAISAALADTLSSEIGLLSKTKPRLITSFVEVEPGTDGGITFLGLVASLFGGLAIGLVHFAFFHNIAFAAIVVLCGVAGSIADSIIGAVFERKNLVSNDMVNFLATIAGAAIAMALSALL